MGPLDTQAYLQKRSGLPQPGRRRSPRSRTAGGCSAGGPRCGRRWAGSAPARLLRSHRRVRGGHTHGLWGPRGPGASSLLSLWPQLGTLIPALFPTPRPVTFPPTRHHPQNPRGQDQGGAVGTPRPASGACPLCRASHAHPPPRAEPAGPVGRAPQQCLISDSQPIASCMGGR